MTQGSLRARQPAQCPIHFPRIAPGQLAAVSLIPINADPPPLPSPHWWSVSVRTVARRTRAGSWQQFKSDRRPSSGIWVRVKVSLPSGAGGLMVEPAPIVAPGADRDRCHQALLEPMKAPSANRGGGLVHPISCSDGAGTDVDAAADHRIPR